jgi:hypothetical protein
MGLATGIMATNEIHSAYTLMQVTKEIRPGDPVYVFYLSQ